MQIRAALLASHDRVWRELAEAGNWLTGKERVALAAETRAARECAFCAGRKAALSPFSVSGEHATATDALSPVQVEAVHRIVTDPGRLSRSWVDSLLEAGMSDAEYVELAGLVSAVVVVDTFHAALGLSLRSLPAPIEGEPTRVRPRTAVFEGSYVATIPADGLEPETADLYDTTSFVPNVHRAFSLVPATTRLANDLMASHYLPYERVTRYTDADHDYAIGKMQMELTASRVSIHNECFY